MMAKPVDLDNSLLHQCLDAVIDLPEAHTHGFGHLPLVDPGVGLDELQQSVMMGVSGHWLHA
jgi:hypothetical protein